MYLPCFYFVLSTCCEYGLIAWTGLRTTDGLDRLHRTHCFNSYFISRYIAKVSCCFLAVLSRWLSGV